MLRLLCVATILCRLHPVGAHDSCCKKAATAPELIPDPEEMPPKVDILGNPQMIPDPGDIKPALWDEEDDGEYSPREIPNPHFDWAPKMIRNPAYRPPPLVEKLYAEALKAIPWVVLGVLITALLEVAQLPLHQLRGRLGRASLFEGALIGLATPLCSCGSLPIAAGFVANGVPLPVVVAFLTATQSAGLDSAALTWGLLGPAAALCRLGGAFTLAVCAGAATPRTRALEGENESVGQTASSHALSRLCNAALDTSASIFPLVFAGIALSTTAVHHLPSFTAVVQSHAGGEGLDATPLDSWSSASPGSFAVRLAVLTFALPLQLCEHASVTLAAGIQKAGGPPGLAFAFLLCAPATNMSSLLLLLRVHRGDGHATLAAGKPRLPNVIASMQWVHFLTITHSHPLPPPPLPQRASASH